MSAAMEHLHAFGGADLQIWNNAAYDDGSNTGGSTSLKKPPWHPLRPIPAIRPSKDLFHAADKENRGVDEGKNFLCTPVAAKESVSTRKALGIGRDVCSGAEDGDIDGEIEEVEKEIGRLTMRLEALRLRKAEKDKHAAVQRGRIVPAKFLEPRISSEKKGCLVEEPATKKFLESPASVRYSRRGVSLGPLEIAAAVGSRRPTKRLQEVKEEAEPKKGSSNQSLGTVKNNQVEAPASRAFQESPSSARYGRRGASLGPSEIAAALAPRWPGKKLQEVKEEAEPKRGSSNQSLGTVKNNQVEPAPRVIQESPSSARYGRRGASLGPSEIAAALGPRGPGKKLQEIKEVASPRKCSGRSLSSSPKSRQPAAKLPELRKGITTVESKKTIRKENPAPAPKDLQPKMLFQEAKKQPAKSGQNSLKNPVHRVPSQQETKKPPAKSGQTASKNILHRTRSQQQTKKPTSIKQPRKNMKMRTVASRYSLSTVRVGSNPLESKRRKWSLPDSDKDDEEAATDVKKSRMSMGDDWGVDEEAEPIEQSPPSLMRIARQLPKIRTIRCDAGSPRDSGRAKRVAELVGREKSHFDAAVEEEDTAADA